MKLRTVVSLVVGLMLAVPASAAGQVPSEPGISETCGQPTLIHDGFLADRTVYFRVRTQPDPADPKTTWICYRVKVQPSVDQAGRVDVRTPSATAGLPDSDPALPCGVTGNIVPGPHPIAGTVVGVPFSIDAQASTDEVRVCVDVDSVKNHVVVPLPGVELPEVTITRDSDPWQPTPTMNPEPDLPSSSCYEGDHGEATELVNTDHGPRHLFLYTAQPSATELHVCARLFGPQRAGLHLEVDAADRPRVEPLADTSPSYCGQDIVSLNDPPNYVKVTRLDQSPPAICVNGTRYMILTGPVPPLVRVTLDPPA